MAETVFYRPHMSHVDVDGTIHIRASLYDEDGHSSLVMEISPRESDYLFWRWVIEQKQLQRSLDQDEMAEARLQFQRHQQSS